MRQIPEGEYCGDCYLEWRGLSWWCMVYNMRLKLNDLQGQQPYRCPACLSDKPQVMTEEERLNIQAIGYRLGRNEAITIVEKPLSLWSAP